MSQIRAEQIEQIEAIKHDIEAIVEAKRSLFQNLLQLRNDLDRNAGDRWPSFVLRNATSTEINGALGEAVENLPADWVDETHRGERNPEPDWFDINRDEAAWDLWSGGSTSYDNMRDLLRLVELGLAGFPRETAEAIA